jgi:5-guanidino-2-oxopentanoate decarboxylase
MTCAEAVVEVLASHGPGIVFGFPGAHTVSLHRAILRDSRLRHILVRHEQGAAFAADGFARTAGQAGVFITTAGPGATNTLTAVAESFTNSVATVHLCCQVDSRFVGRSLGAWHEGPVEAIFRPVTKWNVTAEDPSGAPLLVLRALKQAASGRPRPTQVCIPRDLLGQPAEPPDAPTEPTECPAIDPDAVTDAARVLAEAKRPVMLVGGGAVGAATEVARLARSLRAGVAVTCMGKGIFPDDDPLSLGASFSEAATTAFSEADLCLAVGCRFTQVGTRNWHLSVPGNLIHIDIDPAVIGLHYEPRVPIVADAGLALSAVAEEVGERADGDAETWAARVGELRRRERTGTSPEIRLCRTLREAIPREAVIVGDVASLVYEMFRHFDAYRAGSFLYPAGYIAMGYGLPAAIGAQLARPDALVVCVTGDGSFGMTATEAATAVQHAAPVKIVLLNNDSLAAIAHFCGPDADGMRGVTSLQNPDFVALAGAFGMPAAAVPGEDLEAVGQKLRWLCGLDGPALLEIRLAPRDASA